MLIADAVAEVLALPGPQDFQTRLFEEGLEMD
jgi:hypothetical protein